MLVVSIQLGADDGRIGPGAAQISVRASNHVAGFRGADSTVEAAHRLV